MNEVHKGSCENGAEGEGGYEKIVGMDGGLESDCHTRTRQEVLPGSTVLGSEAQAALGDKVMRKRVQ